MSTPGPDAALNAFFNRLHICLKQEDQKRVELADLADQRQRVCTAIRSIIATVDAPHRSHWHTKLNRVLGKVDPKHAERLPTHATTRTRMIRTWLRDQAPAEFRNTDLLRALRQRGEPIDRNYVGTTLGRMADKGIVEKIGHGRYRANPGHPALGEG